jgi:hypothetical protein
MVFFGNKVTITIKIQNEFSQNLHILYFRSVSGFFQVSSRRRGRRVRAPAQVREEVFQFESAAAAKDHQHCQDPSSPGNNFDLFILTNKFCLNLVWVKLYLI